MDFFFTIGKLEEILQKQNSFSTKYAFGFLNFFYKLIWIQINIFSEGIFSSQKSFEIMILDLTMAKFSLLAELFDLETLAEDPFWLCFSFETECCLSKTVGQIQIGGRRWMLFMPRLHSGVTWLAHRLWSWKTIEIVNKLYKMYFNILTVRWHHLQWSPVIPL